MIKRFIITMSLICLSQSAFSDLYSIEITSPDSTDVITQTFTTIDSLIDATEQRNIDLNGYNQNSEATIAILLGNTPASLTYEDGSTDLSFVMDQCGINVTFSGVSRTANENSFRDYLDDNEDGVLTDIADCLIADNANNPVAVTFRNWVEFGDEFSHNSDLEANQENLGLGIAAGHFSSGEQSHSIITLPISYTHYFEEEGRKLTVSAPVSYIDVDGSKAYKGSIGASYTRPMNDKWTIIPAARIGVTTSSDMGTGAAVASALLTNVYEFPYGDKNIKLANMVGVLTSIDAELGSLASYYDLNNQVIKNGISVEIPQAFVMFGGETSIQASVANTQFFGDEMKVDNYTDVAVSFGTRRKVGNKDNQDSLHLGVTYTVGNGDYKGGKINFGYEF